MLIINGKKYAKNDREFTETLFQKDGTANGFYKKTKTKILLMDMQKEVFAAIVCHKNFTGIVNAIRLDCGRIFYQYGLSEISEKLSGLPERYSEQKDYAKSLFMSV